MSHKIKFNLNQGQNKKPLEEQPNEKISISINSSRETKKKIENIDNKNIKAKKILVKPVLLDANLHKPVSYTHLRAHET